MQLPYCILAPAPFDESHIYLLFFRNSFKLSLYLWVSSKGIKERLCLHGLVEELGPMLIHSALV